MFKGHRVAGQKGWCATVTTIWSIGVCCLFELQLLTIILDSFAWTLIHVYELDCIFQFFLDTFFLLGRYSWKTQTRILDMYPGSDMQGKDNSVSSCSSNFDFEINTTPLGLSGHREAWVDGQQASGTFTWASVTTCHLWRLLPIMQLIR